MIQRIQLTSLAASMAAIATVLPAQSLEERVSALEGEIERMQLSDVVHPVGDGLWGLGPSASKVYGQDGLSIGGYGEFLYQQISGAPDRFDALRGVLYVGYKFDENWLVNTEIEIEHGSTSSSSGTTSSGGSVSLEFGYIDHLFRDELNFRAGLLLAPIGLINELHEPTAFLGAARPETEQRIIPSTWRSTGAGIFGEAGGFAYRAYALSSLNGEAFTSGGLRGGRQKGNRSASDDFAFAGRLDWVDTPGLLAGVSLYFGDTGQDGVDRMGNVIPNLQTTLVEAHVDYELDAWRFRGLYASAWIEDTTAFNTNTGNNLAQRLEGWYVEAGYDIAQCLWPDGAASTIPFLRYEEVDTQADLASGFVADPTLDESIITFGINHKPIDQVVIKAEFQAFEEADDRFQVLFGYAF